MRDVNLAVALAHDLRAWDHFRRLHGLHLVLLGVRGRFTLGFGGSLHDLADLVSGVRGLDPLELLLFGDKTEVRDRFGLLAAHVVDDFRVHYVLVLVLEAAARRVA